MAGLRVIKKWWWQWTRPVLTTLGALLHFSSACRQAWKQVRNLAWAALYMCQSHACSDMQTACVQLFYCCVARLQSHVLCCTDL